MKDAAITATALADQLAEVGGWFRHGIDWPLVAPAPRSDWLTLSVIRASLFRQPEVPAQTGLIFERPPAVRSRIASAHDIMAVGWSHPMAPQAFIIAMLSAQPYELPLMPDSHACPEFVLEAYLSWLFARPVYRKLGDDERYVAWLPSMLDWVRSQLEQPALRPRLAMMANTIIARLDIGMVVYADVAIRPVLDARARLIATMTRMLESLRGTSSGVAATRTPGARIRLGVLLRTILKHPDPLAFCAQFEHFDPERYEIIVYSQDLIDRQCEHDIALYQRLFRFVSKIRSLNGLSVRQMIDRIHGDDLDLFVYSYAATIGASPTDLLVFAKLARAQVLMNSYVPMATGFPSFTHVATVEPHPTMRCRSVTNSWRSSRACC
jgi:hypothetical protein